MKKYGLISYTNTGNIGDEIQSLAARQFLPHVDYYIDREELHLTSTFEADDIYMIANGWFCHYPERWPPSNNLRALLISMHISPLPSTPGSTIISSQIFTSPPVLDYLKKNGPVGARDQQTLQLLQDAGINSYFSGCMTLTLQRPNVVLNDDLIAINEVPNHALKYIRSKSKKRFFRTNHVNFVESDRDERFARAQEMLDFYARASCVVTTRLHCALPCLAMGTPVLLLDTAPDQNRFAGLNQFLHHGTVSSLLNGSLDYNFDAPPPNKTAHLSYREALIRRVTKFVDAEKIVDFH